MKASNAKLDRHQTEAMLRQTEEQRAAFLEGVTGLLASLDGMPAKPRLGRELSAADRRLLVGMDALERDMRQAAMTGEEKVDRLRQLAIDQRREPETIGQVLARRMPPPLVVVVPEPEAPKQLEQHHGDAAE